MSRPRGFIVLGYAVTALHPGVGRAPGTVDLPVQRDPMGYPMVHASSVKGAFKAECGRRVKVEEGGVCWNNEGRIDCSRCPLCCCLFGHELGGESAAGLLAVLDMVPLFFPVPSLSHGYLYVTTPYLAARALAVLDAVAPPSGVQSELDSLKDLLQSVKEKGSSLGEGQAVACSGIGGEVYVGSTGLNVTGVLEKGSCDEKLKLVSGLGGIASTIASRLIVVSDADGPLLVEKGLVRLTRVKLRVDTKTVAGRALWTEEYIPQGTVFISGFAALTPRSNRYCCRALKDEGKNGGDEGKSCVVVDKDVGRLLTKFMKLLGGDDCKAYAIVGGKETIGKGMLLLQLKPCPSRGDKQ